MSQGLLLLLCVSSMVQTGAAIETAASHLIRVHQRILRMAFWTHKDSKRTNVLHSCPVVFNDDPNKLIIG